MSFKNKKSVLVVAPHPDDESLGCGGTLLKHKHAGDDIHWLIVTGAHQEHGFSQERVESRAREIELVTGCYKFNSVHNLMLPTTKLDTLPRGKIIELFSVVFKQTQPNIVYVPHRGDVHSDHIIVFDCAIACTKWFRYPSVKKIMSYEVMSETEFGLNPDVNGFRPNCFVDISDFLDKKIKILNLYEGEMGAFPFPRSNEALRALAQYRGASAGVNSAEAFMILKEVI